MTQRIKSFFQKIGNGLRKVFVDPVRNMNSGAKFYISRTLPLVCAVLFAITAFTLDELGFAYRVEYGGKVIGYVNDVNSAKTAADRINSNIAASYGQKDLVLSYSSTLVLANKSSMVSEDSLYSSMISATPGLSEACGIYSGNELLLVCPDEETARRVIETRLYSYRTVNPNCGDIDIAEFITYKKGLFPTEQVIGYNEACAITGTLPVMESVVETHSDSIAYKTVSNRSSIYCIGTTFVTVEGQNGSATVTDRVCYIDGVEVFRKQLNYEIVAEPVDKVITVGTKEPTVMDAGGLTWPIDGSAFYIITAYWGDGRNHRAIDIACDQGTAILAAQSGIVEEVVYNHSTYGHYLTINHGGGVKTRYAHCSAINAVVGQNIAPGEVVAAVGSTGRSTGPHLHFEYILNGERVNPAPFLGI